MAFTGGQCRFDEIVPLVSDALAAFDDGDASTLDGVLAADAWARGFVRATHRWSGRGSMIQFLIYAGAFILVLVTVITVHEFGHFAVGKLSGIKVEEFADRLRTQALLTQASARRSTRSGPSPPVASCAWRGCSDLAGETDAGERNFYRATRPRRFATVSAGIIANFIFGGADLRHRRHAADTVTLRHRTPPRARPGSGRATRSSPSTARRSARTTSPTSPPTCTTPPRRARDARCTSSTAPSDGSIHNTLLTPRLTLSNVVTDQSTVAGGKLPAGGLR